MLRQRTMCIPSVTPMLCTMSTGRSGRLFTLLEQCFLLLCPLVLDDLLAPATRELALASSLRGNLTHTICWDRTGRALASCVGIHGLR